MARYTGPKTKVSRRYGVLVHGSPKAFENKNYPPGQHGPKGSRRKLSDYALALAEKQKLRYQYGVLERQFRRYFQLALSKRGVTGEILLQLLETRSTTWSTSWDSQRPCAPHGRWFRTVTSPSTDARPISHR